MVKLVYYGSEKKQISYRPKFFKWLFYNVLHAICLKINEIFNLNFVKEREIAVEEQVGTVFRSPHVISP